VVHIDALAAGLLVAVVSEAHGGAVGSREGEVGLLAGAEGHVGGVLVVVVGDAGVVDREDADDEGCEEELEGRHGCYVGCCLEWCCVKWCWWQLLLWL
jgi:hypothetical protein